MQEKLHVSIIFSKRDFFFLINIKNKKKTTVCSICSQAFNNIFFLSSSFMSFDLRLQKSYALQNEQHLRIKFKPVNLNFFPYDLTAKPGLL